jgi:nucleoside phosphorylase
MDAGRRTKQEVARMERPDRQTQEPYALTVEDVAKLKAWGHPRVLLITAADPEREAVLERLEAPLEHGRFVEFSQGDIEYLIGRMGKFLVAHVHLVEKGVEEALLTMSKAVDLWGFCLVAMPGIACGLLEDQQTMFDLLLATEIVPYQWLSINTAPNGSASREMRHDPFKVDKKLTDWVLKYTQDWEHENPTTHRTVKVWPGPILSHTTKINHQPTIQEIRDLHPAAIGLEMEGAGLAKVQERFNAALDTGNVHVLLAKSICDWGYKKAHTQEHYAQRLTAAQISTDFFCHLFSSPGKLSRLGIGAISREVRRFFSRVASPGKRFPTFIPSPLPLLSEPHESRKWIPTPRCRAVMRSVREVMEAGERRALILEGDRGVGKTILVKEIYNEERRAANSRFAFFAWKYFHGIEYDAMPGQGAAIQGPKTTLDDLLQEVLMSHGRPEKGNLNTFEAVVKLLHGQPTLMVADAAERLLLEEEVRLTGFVQGIPERSFLILTSTVYDRQTYYAKWIARRRLTGFTSSDRQSLREYIVGRLTEVRDRWGDPEFLQSFEQRVLTDNELLSEILNRTSGNPRGIDALVESGDVDGFLAQHRRRARTGVKASRTAPQDHELFEGNLNILVGTEYPPRRLAVLMLLCLFRQPTERRLVEASRHLPWEDSNIFQMKLPALLDEFERRSLIERARKDVTLVFPDRAGARHTEDRLAVQAGLSEYLFRTYLPPDPVVKEEAQVAALRAYIRWACALLSQNLDWETDAQHRLPILAERGELNEAARHWLEGNPPYPGGLAEATEGLLLPLAHFEHNSGNWTQAEKILNALVKLIGADERAQAPELTEAQRETFCARADLLIARQAAHARDMETARRYADAANGRASRIDRETAMVLLPEVRLRQAMARMDYYERPDWSARLKQVGDDPAGGFRWARTLAQQNRRKVTDLLRGDNLGPERRARLERVLVDLQKVEISAYGYLAEIYVRQAENSEGRTNPTQVLNSADSCLDAADPLIKQLKWQRPHVHHLRLRGDIHRLRGRLAEARQYYLESLRIAQEAETNDARLHGWNYLGLAEIEEVPDTAAQYAESALEVFKHETFPDEFRRARALLRSFRDPSPRIFLTGPPAAGKTTARETVLETLAQGGWGNTRELGMEEALRELLQPDLTASDETSKQSYQLDVDGALILNNRETQLPEALALLVDHCFAADRDGHGFVAEIAYKDPHLVLLGPLRLLLRGALVLHLRAGLEERLRRNQRRGPLRMPEEIVREYQDNLEDAQANALERAGAELRVFHTTRVSPDQTQSEVANTVGNFLTRLRERGRRQAQEDQP